MLIKYTMLFFIYSFFGWVSEIIYCLIVDKNLVNRGFLKGPLCPIYGVGATLVVAFLEGLKGQTILIFILGLLIASIVEYITSYLLEIVFKARWWDYTNNKFNINGRVCLTNSILFGILSVLLIDYLHPFVVSLLGKISRELLVLSTLFIVILFFIDLLKSIKAILSINTNLNEINDILTQLNRDDIDFKTVLKDEENCNKRLEIKGLKDRLKSNLMAGEREKGIMRAFPRARHREHNDIFKKFKNLNK